MAFRTFKQRMQESRGEVSDVLQYETLPPQLRGQLIHIFRNTLGGQDEWYDTYGNADNVRQVYKYIADTMREELGTFSLTKDHGDDRQQVEGYILQQADVEQALSLIEICCVAVYRFAASYRFVGKSILSEEERDARLRLVNARFKQHGVGYAFESGELVRIDSQLIHAEAVKPALTLLSDKQYAGAQEEFLKAYAHYRDGKNKEAVTEAAKAFESVMKSILAKRGWTHNPADPAKKLIAALIGGGLLPKYSESQLNGLTTLLEGVPTPRNKNAAHGQGAAPVAMSDEMTGYVLHMTASTIVFLVKAEQALP